MTNLVPLTHHRCNFVWFRLAIIGLALLCTVSPVSRAWAKVTAAAKPYYARTWQTDDGLPRNTITAIAQTADGYLWLGTPQGVIRFDGAKFTPMEDDVFAGFVRARTRVLFVDRLDRLWIGTGTAGVIRYDGKGFKVINAQNGLPHPTINAICEDFKGTIWLACQNGSLSWVDADDVVHPVAPPTGKPVSDPIQLVRDARGRLWFAQRDTYGQLLEGVATNVTRIPASEVVLCPSRDGGMWVTVGTELQKLPPPESNSVVAVESIQSPIKRYQVISMLEDHLGDLWIGTRSQGLFHYSNHKFTQEFNSSHRIASLCEDTEFGLWIGTEGGGISRLRPQVFQIVTVRAGSPNSVLLSVCEGKDGTIWLSSQGPNLTKITADGQMINLPAFTNISSTCVLPDPDGSVWVGTVNQGLYSVRDGVETQLPAWSSFRPRQIRVLHRDAKGHLWIGCLPDGLAQWGDGELTAPEKYFDQGLPKQAIWAITDDSKGRLWLGTIRGELWCLVGTQFTSYGKADGLPGASIGALLTATNGDLWIGTLGGGLGRLRDGHFVFASVRDGLADDVISSIVDDGHGYFWLGTERGICRVKQRDLEEFADGKRNHFESIRYGKDQGLLSVECPGGYQPAVWRTRAGDIWFATSKGAVTTDPTSLGTNLIQPPLVLEKILVNDEAITNHVGIQIPYGYRELQFEYTSPSFSSPERIRFRHQLVGLDPDWVDAGTTRAVSYPRLAPGRYIFRFTAGNADGVWNASPVSVAFQVIPAYWQTAWFKALTLLTFASLVAWGVRYRYVQKMRRKMRQLEQAHAIEQERMRIARDIHDDLGARLTQMAFLSEMAAGEIGPASQAGERLGKIAEGSRQAIRSLDEIVWAVNPRKDTLPDFLDYLSHYANEFFRSTDIRCRQDLPMIIPEISLSAEVRHHLFLACKEALNNIRKHARATEVWLRMSLNQSVLEITIEDNGSGFQSAATSPPGNGLLNLETRLAAVGGCYQVVSQPGRGTLVRFCLTLPDGVRTASPSPIKPNTPK